MPYFFLKIFYLGDRYHGSQRQPKLPTIEQHLIDALALKRYIPREDTLNYFFVDASGRTDKGVHALGSVFGFYSLRDEIYPIEINKVLPRDIFIWQFARIHEDDELEDFLGKKLVLNPESIRRISKRIKHPRHQAQERIYKYFYHDWDEKLNQKLIKEACEKLKGHHNYRNFSKPEEGRLTERTIDSITFEKQGEMLVFEFQAQSFQWKQIRKMIGVIRSVAAREWPLEHIQRLFNPNETDLAMKIPIAPAENLILWDVKYNAVNWENCDISLKEMRTELKARLIRLSSRKSMLNRIFKNVSD